MTTVLLHHALIAAVATTLFTFMVVKAQHVIADRVGLAPENKSKGQMAVAIAFCALATLVACWLYIASTGIAATPWLQLLLDGLAASTGVVLVGRCLDKRFASVPTAVIALVLAAIALSIWTTHSNLVNFLTFSAIGFAALLKYPALEPNPFPFWKVWWQRLQKARQPIGSVPRPQAAGRIDAPIVGEKTVARGGSGYTLRPKYQAPEEETPLPSGEGS